MKKFLHAIGYISAFALGSLAGEDSISSGMMVFIAATIFTAIMTLTKDTSHASISK